MRSFTRWPDGLRPADLSLSFLICRMGLMTFPVLWGEMFCLTVTRSEVFPDARLLPGALLWEAESTVVFWLRPQALRAGSVWRGRGVPGPLAAALSADLAQHVWWPELPLAAPGSVARHCSSAHWLAPRDRRR